MFKNIASQKLTVYVFDSLTNLPKTGDAGNLTAYRDLDDGGVTVLTDTSATEKDSTNAKGFYIFDLSQVETNGDKIMFSCKSSTANMVCLAMPAVVYTTPPNFSTTSIDSSGRMDLGKWLGSAPNALTSGRVDVILGAVTAGVIAAASFAANALDAVWSTAVRVLTAATNITSTGGTTVPQTGDSFARLGAPAGASVSADVAAVKVDTAAVKVQTDKLTFTVANQVDSNVLDWKSATAPAMTGDAFARLGAPAGASVSVDIAAIAAKTTNLPSDPADASDIASSFSTVSTTLSTIAGYLDTEIAAIKAKTDNLPASPAAVGSAMTLTSGERDSIAAAHLDLAAGVETGLTVRQAMRLGAAADAGKVSGMATTTVVIRNAVADSKDRITATVDANGNRSALVYDLT